MSLVIVDTGCANLASVGFAFDRLGAAKTISADGDVISAAERVIIPGVGAAGYAMEQLRARGLVDVLKNLSQPVLGICLGMQLLFERSEEDDAGGLGLIDGMVNAMDTGTLPSPHMGWNQLIDLADDPLLEGVENNAYVYFVHSYAVPVTDKTLASCDYGHKFSAIVKSGNVYGCQFHPERSGQAGAQILKNFLKVQP